MQLPIKTRYYTPEEYLELEEKAQYKSEYRDGEIIPMAGGTTNHNKICLNFCRYFPLTIENEDYDVFMEGVRLYLPQHNLYTYPDVMIIKGEPIYHGLGTSNVTNPQIIIEVLSKSTASYDRGDKFQLYRSLPTFQEYLLIDQYTYSVEKYYRQSQDQWLVHFYTRENAIVKLFSVNWQISLRDLYKRINFDLSKDENEMIKKAR